MKTDSTYSLAKDHECVECGERAVVFFPAFDPDIPSYPYCRKCVDKKKIELLKMIL